jgi:cytochrome c553
MWSDRFPFPVIRVRAISAAKAALLIAGCLGAMAAWAGAAPPPVNPIDEDQPTATSAAGLLVRYVLPNGASIARVEPVPRIPGLCSAVAARIGAKPTADQTATAQPTVQWTGFLAVPGDGSYVFTARQAGVDDLKIAIAGKPIALGAAVQLSAGLQPIRISARSATSSGFLEPWWRGAAFDDEPIGPRFFRHDPAAAHEKTTVEMLAASRSLNRGAVLAELYACARCHGDATAAGESLCAGLRPDKELLPGPRLDGVGRRLQPQWILNRLTEQKPPEGSRMPVLFGTNPDELLAARIVATYLAGAQLSMEAAPPHRGNRGEQLFKAAGCAACHSAPKGIEPDFQLTSTVPSLYGIASKWTASGLIAFLRQPLEMRPQGRMPDEHLNNEDATALADYLFSGLQPDKASTAPPPPVTEAQLAGQWRALGGRERAWRRTPSSELIEAVALRLMASRRCFSCHELSAPGVMQITRSNQGDPKVAFFTQPQAVQRPLPPLNALAATRLETGCLAPEGKTAAAPRFDFTDEQRHDLAAHFGSGDKDISLSALERLRIDMAVLNCARCHENEGQGGQSLAALLEGNPDAKFLVPPTLTRVGERLRTDQLRQWVSQGAGDLALRPWVAAHMPGFGARGARVADALAVRDGTPGPAATISADSPIIHAATVEPERVSTGRSLAGLQGLACINCHGFQGHLLSGKDDPTTRAPDLTRVAQHLRPEYFYRWLMNPARIRPGTKMPQTIPRDGRIALAAYRNLPPGEPLNALWSYLCEGPRAEPPQLEQTVLQTPEPGHPIVQRGETHSDVGKNPTRGISLGFADGTLLFDADQLSPVAVWYSGFVKANAQSYFGLWWSHEGSRPEAIPTEFARLSFKQPGETSWKLPPTPIQSDPNSGSRLDGYRIGANSIRLRYRLLVDNRQVSVSEDVRVETRPQWNGYRRQFLISGLPAGAQASLTLPQADRYERWSEAGANETQRSHGQLMPAKGLAEGDSANVVIFSLPGDGNLHAVFSLAGGTRWETSQQAGKPVLEMVTPPAEIGRPVAMTVQYWSRHPAPGPELGTLLFALLKEPAPVADEFSPEIKPPAPVEIAPAPKPNEPVPAKPTRSAVNHKRNVDQFPSVVAKFVRMTILAVEGDQAPGIDEFEIFGADPKRNLALAGKATASSVIAGYKIHQIAHLNDGIVGNDRSWVGGENGHAWIQIELPEAAGVHEVVWARDQTGICNDRLATKYEIETSLDGRNWTRAIDSGDRAPMGTATVNADASPGYKLEAIPAPFPGIRPAGIKFGPDGMLYVIAMSEGQIWRTPIPPPDHPDQVHWSRYASGLAHPIGLTFIDGRLFVAQKPEITELIDHTGRGTVDEYRTVASGWSLSQGWHEYCFGLESDRHKNLYFALNTGYFWTNPGYVNPGRFRGSVMRVDYPSERLEEVAKGCRVPNGVVRGPDGEMFFTDNQGDWIQVCKLAHIVPGRFYGHPERKQDALPPNKYPDGDSAVWLPYDLSRSTSGPVFDESGGKFGPFSGQFFVGDVGYGANPGIMRLELEKVDGEYQGAAFRWCDGQPLGCERMAFGPDHQLYMTSFTTGLTRMRYVGPTPLAIESMHIRPGGKGFVVSLTKPLADGTKLDPSTIRAKHYHYLYTGNYGSPLADITPVKVASAELSADRRSITLSFPVETYGIGMVYELNLGQLVADGGQTLVHNDIWYTVNRIPK